MLLRLPATGREAALILALASAIIPVGGGVLAQGAPPSYQFVNGLWFDGEAFRADSFFAVDGVLTRTRPATVDSVIDLGGGRVVPAFGEAHNHNVDVGNDDMHARYLEHGIFYVKNPNSFPSTRDDLEAAGAVNRPETLDAVFAGGSVTSTGGHPSGLHRRNVNRGVWTEADGDGRFFFYVDTPEDVARRWPEIAGQNPDFIKTYLLFSEEWDERGLNERYFAWYGLDPEVLPLIVERAHAAGLRVSTHVESGADFHHAVNAGVDEINHLPGFRTDGSRGRAPPEAHRIDEADARRAAERGVVVVTTVGGMLEATRDADPASGERGALLARYGEVARANLALLERHGVTIAVGTDSYDRTSRYEARQLHETGIFTEAELLRMWSHDTVRTIFPDRRIGRLEEGWEASFIVLEGNPLEDFGAVERIGLRVKEGRVLGR